jgi:hypothetical protein
MINTFPPQNQNFRYLQTNRSDRLGSIWSSFNLDFQKKLGTLKLSNKLVTTTTSSDDADLGLPTAFEFFYNKWFAICGTRVFKNNSSNIITAFVEDFTPFSVADTTSRFDITNPAGTTFRYTYDGTGTNPGITALTFPIGGGVSIQSANINANNRGVFTITGSGANYFEVTNAAGVAEADKVLGTGGFLAVGGSATTIGKAFSPVLSDLCVFNDKLWATDELTLWSKLIDITGNTADIWTKVDTLTSSTTVHKMVYFKKHNRLYYINSNSNIRSIDNNGVIETSGNYTLNPGKSIGKPSTMAVSNSYIWVAGYTYDGVDSDSSVCKLKGTISQWDGFSAQPTNEFIIPTAGVLAIEIHDDIPYAIDTEGRILKYTGYSFSEVARLPIDRTLLLNATEDTIGRFIHFNGMSATKNNTIEILINNTNEDASATINENLPSGIWELDIATNSLTHRYSATLKAITSDTVVDYGQNRVSGVGALKFNTMEDNTTTGRSTRLVGINYYTDATTVKSGIFVDSPYKPATDHEGQKRGYFVTTWFESPQITSNWTRLWATFKKMLNATDDKMIFKYRLDDYEPVEATITWVTQTTFTTTTDVSAYEGFEAEIIQGTGSGACCDITDVSEDGGAYTVTIRSEVPVTATTAKAKFQKWIYLGEIASQTLAYGSLPIIANDVRIQIKGILEWTGDNEFTKMAIVSKDDININP